VTWKWRKVSATHRKWLHQRRRAQPISSDTDRYGRAGKPNCDAAPPSRSAARHYWVRSICGTHVSSAPCLLATAVCLLPPADTTCYICCRRLLCGNQARGCSGLEAFLGRVWAIRLWLVWSLTGARSHFVSQVAWTPWSSAQGCFVGWLPSASAPRYCIVSNMSSFAPFETSDETLSTPPQWLRRLRQRCWPPLTCRSQPSPTTNLRCACDRFCDSPRPCLNVNSPHICER